MAMIHKFREADLEASFPELPFTWLPTASGDGFVFLLTRDELLAFIRDSATPVGKREIARAYGLKGDQRIELLVEPHIGVDVAAFRRPRVCDRRPQAGLVVEFGDDDVIADHQPIAVREPVRPVHAPNDGDTVFAAATGKAAALGDAADPKVMTELGTVAADCLARAVARGVYEATALPFPNALPDWKTRFGGR